MGIGIKVQDVEIGKDVYYYSYADKYENSEPKKAVIESKPYEICGTLCCKINISNALVALSNLSFEYIPKKRLTSRKREAKERYAMYENGDGIYDGITFGEFLKYRMYKR